MDPSYGTLLDLLTEMAQESPGQALMWTDEQGICFSGLHEASQAPCPGSQLFTCCVSGLSSIPGCQSAKHTVGLQ